MLDEYFELRTLPPEPFANSIGAFSGRPELIEVEFDAAIADYVASREWHRSQEILRAERRAGSVRWPAPLRRDRCETCDSLPE